MDQAVAVSNEKVPDFVVFDGGDIAEIVAVVKRLSQPRRIHLSDATLMARNLQTVLERGVPVSAEQLRKGVK